MGYRITCKITKLDLEVYEYLRFYKSLTGGNTPTLRAIVRETNCASTSVVSYCLDKLSKAGWIEKKDNTSFIRVVGDRWTCDHDNRPTVGMEYVILMSEDNE